VVRNDQFSYAQYASTSTFTLTGPDGKPITKTFTDRNGQSWVSIDGSKPGWAVGLDKLGHRSGYPLAVPPRADLRTPTYRFLTTLPTDPDALLARIRASVRQTAGSKPGAIVDFDQEVFSTIGGLIHHPLLPPKLGAALYRAAATLPGVTLDRNAVDAAGRRGIGVTRRSAALDRLAQHPVYLMEWIFDAKTYAYLGMKLESDISKSTIAIVKRGVVDHVRELPR
jgi:hypothetical protein